jgi:hypothetical protein
MGAFYGSVHVKSDQYEAVKEALETAAGRKWKFLVSPVMDGWIAVFPNNHGQDERASKAIAKSLAAPILHIAVHDDDVFYFWFYRGGKLLDRFSSCPDFGGVSGRMKSLLQGKPERLQDLLRNPADIERLTALLEAMRSEPLFASDRPEQFARLFGLSNASTSYEDLMADETEGIEGWEEFAHVPDLSEERRAEQEAAARIQRQKDRLRDEGKLLADVYLPAPHLPAHLLWCVHAGKNLVFAQSSLVEPGELQIIPPPWTGQPMPVGIVLEPRGVALAASPKGRYLAVGYGSADCKADVWDWETKQRLLEIKHTSVVQSIAFAADERMVFTMSPQEIAATDLANGRRAGEWSVQSNRAMDLHPQGNIVAVGTQEGFCVLNVESGELRSVRLGAYQDLSGLREYLQTQLRQEMEKVGPDWVASQVEKTLQQLDVPEESIVGKRIREDTEKGIADVLSGKAFAHLGPRTFQPENVFCMKFVGGGKLLACSTDKALRIFDAESLFSAREGDLKPRVSAPLMPVPSDFGYLTGYIYAVVDDPENNSVLFGGLDGSIRSLSLATGEATDLFIPPGAPPIMQMKLEGSMLFCFCQPGFPETRGRRPPPLMQIWEKGKLSRS